MEIHVQAILLLMNASHLLLHLGLFQNPHLIFFTGVGNILEEIKGRLRQ